MVGKHGQIPLKLTKEIELHSHLRYFKASVRYFNIFSKTRHSKKYEI